MAGAEKEKKPNTTIEKPWGYEEIIENNENYTVKLLFMRKGNQCSYQYHEEKRETIMNLKGVLTIVVEDETIVLGPMGTITIAPFTKHRMAAADEDCLYLECSTSQLDDVVRVQDDYGRK